MIKEQVMIYKTSTALSARTEAYRMTVNSKTAPSLLALKADIAKYNNNLKIRLLERPQDNGRFDWCFKKVQLQGRGPRSIKGTPVHPDAARSLRHSYATSFDVYVQNDRTYSNKFDEFIKTGLTISQQDAQYKLECQLSTLKIKQRMRAKIEYKSTLDKALDRAEEKSYA
jgi:hypothetical protein|tara:strand:- start:3144 stop:3653 length:510 start_codon:yes stop_codon:yes gene_type:complete